MNGSISSTDRCRGTGRGHPHRHRRLLPTGQDLRRLRRLRRQRRQGRPRRRPPPPLGGMDAPGRRGQEGGHAQRHRAAAGLGQLRRDHQGVPDQVRHQGRPAPSPTPPARTRSPRPRTSRASPRRPTSSTSAPAVALANTEHVRAVQGRDVRRGPRRSSRTPSGTWVNDYGGYMSIGYDAARCRRRPPSPTCSSRQYKGKVALNGDPTKAGAAFSGVVMAAHRQGRLRRRHQQGRRLLHAAQGGRQLPAGRPDARPPSSPARRRSSSTGTTSTSPRAPSSRARSTGRPSSRRTRRSAATTSRPSTRTPRTRRPPGCGRSSSTPTRARTSGSRAAPGRSARRPWSRPARSTRRRTAPCPRPRARPVLLTQAQTDKAGRVPARPTGPRPLADLTAPAHRGGARPVRRPVGRPARCWACVPVLRLHRRLPAHPDARRGRRGVPRRRQPAHPRQHHGARPAAGRLAPSCNSVVLSAVTAVARRGARRAAAYAVATGRPGGMLAAGHHRRRAACSPSSAASHWRSPSSRPSACRASSPSGCRQVGIDLRRRRLALRADPGPRCSSTPTSRSR